MFALASVNSKNEVNTKSEHIRLLFFSMFSRERVGIVAGADIIIWREKILFLLALQ